MWKRLFGIAGFGLLWGAVVLDLLEPGRGQFYNPVPELTAQLPRRCPKTTDMVQVSVLPAQFQILQAQLGVATLESLENTLGTPVCLSQKDAKTTGTWVLPIPKTFVQLTFQNGEVIHYALVRETSSTATRPASESRSTVSDLAEPAEVPMVPMFTDGYRR